MYHYDEKRSHIEFQTEALAYLFSSNSNVNLTLKAPITTAANVKFCDIFPNFQKK